jgi:predicted phage terminase large subunit-like protein
VAYQAAAIETMKRNAIPTIEMRPIADKRARLMVAAQFIKDGTVMFPRTGCEGLLNQLYGFGAEAHDDMVDALVYLILGTVTEGMDLQRVVWAGSGA